MMDVGKRIDGKFNVWRMRHDGRHYIVAVCETEEEALLLSQKTAK